MSTPSHPAALELSAGTHALCTCGLIKNGPFCDGSHQGSGKTPPHPQARRPKNYLPLQLRRHGQQPLLRRQPRQSQCCSSSGSKAALVEGLGLSETHLGAHVVGRQLVSNKTQQPKTTPSPI